MLSERLCLVGVSLIIRQLCVVSSGEELDGELDMATLFFNKVFGNDTAPRVMSGIISLSIFGNIVIMTFTASRGLSECDTKPSSPMLTVSVVKQEIAKEGVLPFSKFFARSVITPFARLRRMLRSSRCTYEDEESPAPALFLHWSFTMLMIASTSSLTPTVAYQVLVSLYMYIIVAMVGLSVAGGLLYLRWSRGKGRGKEWTDNIGFKPWGGPTAAILYRYATTCTAQTATDSTMPARRVRFCWSRHSCHLLANRPSGMQAEATSGMPSQLRAYAVLQ